ncbi:MAG: nodulation S family protein [Actinomycetota bacterium]|nr:nodulation S family protein [Actinomycetota bacterium]
MSDPAPGGEVGADAAPTPRSYFEDLYGRDDDPWDFATSAYEARKYAITLASLPDDRYRRAFEPGCSVGVLTEGLAGRCDSLFAADHMDEAVTATRLRTARCPGVTVERRTIPEEWPEGPFDLVVLSEVAYYFDDDGLRRLLAVATASTGPGAVIVAVHWRGATDYPLTGDQAHALMAATPGLVEVVHHLEDAFVLDVWRYQVPDADRTGTGRAKS